MKKLIPVILCCAMLLAACGSSADSTPAASESTSAAASSEAASSAESIIGGADGETDIVVSDEANTANLDAAVAAIGAVNPIANPRALDDFSVENELMLTMDNLVGYKGDVTNDQADCGLVFVAQAKDGKVDAVKAELEAYKESLSANDLYAEFADKVALAKDARIVSGGLRGCGCRSDLLLGGIIGQRGHSGRLLLVLEINHEQVAGRGVLHTAELLGHELGHLHGKVYEVVLALEIRAQLSRKPAVREELTAAVIHTSQRMPGNAHDVRFDVLVRQIQLIFGKHVHA